MNKCDIRVPSCDFGERHYARGDGSLPKSLTGPTRAPTGTKRRECSRDKLDPAIRAKRKCDALVEMPRIVLIYSSGIMAGWEHGCIYPLRPSLNIVAVFTQWSLTSLELFVFVPEYCFIPRRHHTSCSQHLEASSRHPRLLVQHQQCPCDVIRTEME